MRKQDKCTTALVYELQQKVTITNPFHPRYLEEFSLLQCRNSRGCGTQVYLRDKKGKMFSVPITCTNAQEADSFLQISTGRSYFHSKDLVRLVYLIEELVEDSYNKKSISLRKDCK